MTGKTLLRLLALLICVVAIGAQSDPGTKTIVRRDDPLIVKGSDLKCQNGVPPARLGFYSLAGGTLSPVPFQIDQKKPDGVYAFTSGLMAGTDPDPNFDANDELVFLARDLGDRLHGPWPAGATAGAEIEVRDPGDGRRGWAYLFRFGGPAPRSAKDYIRFEVDTKRNRRWCRSDELVIGTPLDRVYPDYIANARLINGRPGKDVMDRLKVRGELVVAGMKFPFNADELIKTRDQGYIDGTVRVVQYTQGYMEFSGVELKGMGNSTLFFYPNHVAVPITIAAGPQIPDWVIKLIPDGRVAGYFDFNRNIFGSRVFSSASPVNPEVVLDGKTSRAEAAIDRSKRIGWLAGYGPQGGILVRLIIPPVNFAASKLTTYYVDDINGQDPPEDDAGTMSVGFDISGERKGDIGGITRASSFTLYIYGKNDLTEKNAHELLDILDRPLAVSAAPLP